MYNPSGGVYEKLLERERKRASLYSILEQVDKSSPLNVRSEPIIEILSVNFSFPKSKELYGDIYLYDALSEESYINRFIIYQRDKDDPDLSPTLRLTGPHYAMSMVSPFICFNIWDKLTGEAVIREGCFPLEKTIDTPQQHHQFEQFKNITFPCLGGYANIEYLALTFGVFCRVQVQLFKEQGQILEEADEEIEVYGSVSAEYSLYCFQGKHNTIKLFEINKDSNNPERVKSGSYIVLSRSVVAVPAYSLLTIQLELVDGNQNNGILCGSCEFNTHNYRESHRIIRGLNGLIAQLSVDWKEPFMLDCPQTSFANEDTTRCLSHFSPNPMKMKARRVVEIFSVFIGRLSDKQLKLHGSILFVGARGKHINIFQRDINDPYIISPGCNIIPLGGHRNALVPKYKKFHFSVNLEDAETGESIKGIANSSNGINEQFEPWYDRLLCSVVKGSSSFAAVHYTVFLYALKATLKLNYFYKGEHSSDAYSRIHGSIVAYYGKYGCRNVYERLYFRSVLFECFEENPVEQPCKDFDMDLLRCVFALPCDSCLDIVVDLSCYLSSTGLCGRLVETMVLQIGIENLVIHGEDFGINIAVEWSEA